MPREHQRPSRPAARGTFERSEALARLAGEEFDVLVVGGGITGAGVALDAASRGLQTALVERDDLASGTSSKSSKLVHGGIRYLQQREIRLVYESLHERQRLLDNTPHLATPLPFLVPLFGRDGVVQRNVARAYSGALWTYDITGGWRIGKRHRRIGRAEALEHLPTLRTDRLAAGFLYYDAWADDARLTLEVARTAALDHGAVVVNYAGVEGLLRDNAGNVEGALVRPRRVTPAGSSDGARDSDADEAIEVRAGVVVNATGVWADDLRSLEAGEHPHSLRPAKGVHVTLPRKKLPADIAAVVPVSNDKRSIFVVPWPDGDDVYVGTTDTAWDGSLDDPACAPEDVDYLLSALNHAVSSPLSPEDVTGTWAGLRPLLAPPKGHHVSERTADLSRRHRVQRSRGGVVTVTGGKLTTYRKMAEETVDEALRVLGDAVPAGVRPCTTARLKLRGGEGLEEITKPEVVRDSGVEPEVFRALVGRHGDETPGVLSLASGRPDMLEPIVEGLPYLRVEALWAVREEMALTLDDVLARRTRAALRRATSSTEVASDLAALLAAERGMTPAQAASEARTWATDVSTDLARAAVGVRATHPAP
jgi:glycerol-3-phosphate dehydrogenase